MRGIPPSLVPPSSIYLSSIRQIINRYADSNASELLPSVRFNVEKLEILNYKREHLHRRELTVS